MMKLVLLFSLLATIVFTYTCPNDCSNNGHCNTANGACSCHPDYNGNDCSIFLKALTLNTWLEGRVDIWSWKFYAYHLTTTENLRFEVESLDEGGDCDLYIRHRDRPDRLTWDKKDTDQSADAVIDIENAGTGSWIAGVFGFYPCHYRIRVQFLGSCAVPCGFHGICRDTVCVCDDGYSGEGCTETRTLMTMGRPYTGRVEEAKWKYYKLSLTRQYNGVKVHMNQTGNAAEEDCDLYARFGAIPTEYEWDYFDQNWRETYSVVNLADPAIGDWYIGVYGYAACSFRIQSDLETGCPNRCSMRGVCQRGQCGCQPGYSGSYCENTQDGILLGQRLNGYVEYLTWNFFHISTESQNPLLITVSQNSADADCDLYVRRDEPPTPTLYDYFDVSYEQEITLAIPSPGVATWHIGVYGASYNKPCTYTLTTAITGSCTGCAHGTCLDFGFCQCDAGWGGEQCNVQVIPLNSGQPVTGSITPRTWKYYSIQSSASTIVVSLRETNTVGYIWLYEALEISPNLRYYDEQDIDTDQSFHTITIDASYWADPDTPYTYFIGVYGSPLAARDIEFSLVAWETPYKK